MIGRATLRAILCMLAVARGSRAFVTNAMACSRLLSAPSVGPMPCSLHDTTSMMSRVRYRRAVSTAAALMLGSVGFERGLGMVLPPLPGVMHHPDALSQG